MKSWVALLKNSAKHSQLWYEVNSFQVTLKFLNFQVIVLDNYFLNSVVKIYLELHLIPPKNINMYWPRNLINLIVNQIFSNQDILTNNIRLKNGKIVQPFTWLSQWKKSIFCIVSSLCRKKNSKNMFFAFANCTFFHIFAYRMTLA